jgi:quinol monooxygenase YgiN
MPVLAIVTLEVKPGMTGEFLRTLQRPLELTQAHPNCRRAELYASQADPNRYVLLEEWDTIAAHQAHFQGLVAAGEVAACMPTWNGLPKSTHYQAID